MIYISQPLQIRPIVSRSSGKTYLQIEPISLYQKQANFTKNSKYKVPFPVIYPNDMISSKTTCKRTLGTFTNYWHRSFPVISTDAKFLLFRVCDYNHIIYQSMVPQIPTTFPLITRNGHRLAWRYRRHNEVCGRWCCNFSTANIAGSIWIPDIVTQITGWRAWSYLQGLRRLFDMSYHKGESVACF